MHYHNRQDVGIAEFRLWLKREMPEAIVGTLGQVWDSEREATLEHLYKIFKEGYSCGQQERRLLEEKLILCEKLISARQDININFSLFRKKP